jgi:Fe-S oxidoreductase
MIRDHSRQKRLDWIGDDLKIDNDSETLFFTGCSPYFAAYFGDPYESELTGSLRSAVKLLNAIGIEPNILPNETCCGHDFLLRGEKHKFDSAAKRLSDSIIGSKAKRIVFTCPECLFTLKDKYKSLLSGRGIEFVHLSELAAERIDSLAFNPDKIKVTFQDPCRLGRYSQIFDEPREIISAVPEIKLSEMLHTKSKSICCGNTAWIACDSGTKELQRQKLNEALNVESEAILTACPKCLIHLTCSQNNHQENEISSIKIKDMWNFIGEHLQS